MTNEPPIVPDPDDLLETDIAIVGMAGRFPGAFDAEELWTRVRNGDDCLVDLDADELISKGVPAATVSSPDYVRRTGIVEAVDMFDPGFFGIGKRDAAIMDPQHRLFMECVWEALESSAHTPEGFGGSIGLFGGSGMNTYLLNNLLTNPNILEQLGWFLLRHTSNDKDFLTTTASYRLGLHGPSVNVQTACSTSLVALHLAAQSLLSFECDMALAGGVTLEFPHGVGYEYREGEVLSPDGHCRAFDEQSGGTVLTGGVAVVALRRLTDAYADGDPILAVVKGSAINNDGARKVGYLAPSVDGHADVVKEALAVSGIDPRTIGLIEAHGTGTAVGDPIEVAALTEAFRSGTQDNGFCRLVSTKPNIGHLDTAAGTASVIKVVQALRHRILPPLANHTAPSPLMGIETTPFVVSGSEAPWESTGPRRAGISSLGVGGTNAHVIVEEAPAYAPTPDPQGEQLLVLSGQSRDAVKDGSQRLASFLDAEPDTNLADVAHTLLTGRRAMQWRRVVTARDLGEAAEALRSNDRRRTYTAEVSDDRPNITFMFPGGGAQYVGMGAGLDERFEVFHQIRSEGAAIVRDAGGPDLDELFGVDADDEALRQATASLPAVFITSVALARQWMAWGVEPDSMIGHSLGEYVAAHLAGVLSFEDALALVVNRSILIENVSGDDAAMLVVPLAESDVVARLPAALSLATVNADDECVVAGSAAVVTEFNTALAEAGVVATLIPIAAAGHSSMLDPILDAFLTTVESVTLNPPDRRYLSNLSGTWITAEQATDPTYWVQHLRHTVRFNDCVSAVLDEGATVFVELGPGQSLSSYVRRTARADGAISALRHPNDDVDDTAFTLNAFARLWAHGIDIDLARFTGENRRRLRLPTYAFQRERFFIEPGERLAITAPGASVSSGLAVAAAATGPVRIESIDDMIWTPTWVPAAPLVATTETRRWVLIGDDELAQSALAELTSRGLDVVRVPVWSEDGSVLDDRPTTAVVFGSSTSASPIGQPYESSLRRWLGDAPSAIRALASTNDGGRVVAVTRGALAVAGTAKRPNDALALGAVLTAPGEYPSIQTALVDLDPNLPTTPSDLVDELLGASGVVARRGDDRLTNDLTRTPMAAAATAGFEQGGTYMVTGGLGGIGYEIATHLATEYQANLVLIASQSVPSGEERERYLQQHSYDDPTCRRIRHVEKLEHLGVKVVVVAADTADPDRIRAALDEAERQVGPLTGAVHAAGRLRDRLLETATFDDHEYVVAPKACGALILADELQRRGAQLLVLISSTSTYLAPGGQTSYVAANAVLDSLAGQREQLRIATLNYGVWAGVGIAADVARRQHLALADGTPIDHPVFSEHATTRHGEIELNGRLSTDHQWIVDQHRSEAGIAVLPGTGHLQLLLDAARLAGMSPARLSNVTLLEPLVVPDDRPVTIRVVVGTADGNDRSIRLDSDGGNRRVWTTHSEASVSAAADDVPDTDIDALMSRLELDEIDPLETPRSHLLLGDRWDCLVDARRSDTESAGHLRMTQPSEAEAWSAHPGLVDVATAFGVVLASGNAIGKLAVPIGYDQVTLHRPVPAECVVHARRQHSSTDDVLRVDIDLLTQSGEITLRIDGLQLHPIDDPSALGITLEPDTSNGGAHVAPLLALADGLGFHTDDGMEVLERLVGAEHPRLIVSTVDLESLLEPAEPEAAVATAATVAGSSAATAEAAISAMWSDLLGVAEIAGDDDFFDLGGHSLIAIRLMTRIHRELGVRFQLATIFEASTVDDLAALVRVELPDIDNTLAAAAGSATGGAAAAPAPSTVVSDAPRAPMKHLIPISTKGDKAPLFIVHGAGGNVLFLWSLARAMAGDRPIYGFQAHGIDGADLPDASVQVMAERYAAELREHHEGPYLLGGYSGGGVVTLEMAKILQAQGETVRFVFLFDSVPSGRAWPSKRDRRRNLVSNIRRHGYDRVHPYLRERALATVHKFVPERAELAAVHEADDRDLGYTDLDTQGFVNLFFYFSATAERHVTGVYDVDAAVLKADHVWPYQPDDYYWTNHITGNIALRHVPGDHHSMFYPQNAPRLADVMLELLDKIDRGEPLS